ncbi:hypothetical protein WN51_01416 [Melipona quadrifasciata]|uniref:Uncharacterized protein n=1 Tax=Melipona quadrifasciata TaxID=166423 RepID=A0A0N0BES8_9HYME|nr:hypothetical protein WN51_01416 [Melipona quadrifasciata]
MTKLGKRLTKNSNEKSSRDPFGLPDIFNRVIFVEPGDERFSIGKATRPTRMNQDQEVPATTTDLARLNLETNSYKYACLFYEDSHKLRNGIIHNSKSKTLLVKCTNNDFAHKVSIVSEAHRVIINPNEEFNRLNEPLQTVATGYCSTNYPVTQTSTEEKLHPGATPINLFDSEEHDGEHENLDHRSISLSGIGGFYLALTQKRDTTTRSLRTNSISNVLSPQRAPWGKAMPSVTLQSARLPFHFPFSGTAPSFSKLEAQQQLRNGGQRAVRAGISSDVKYVQKCIKCSLCDNTIKGRYYDEEIIKDYSKKMKQVFAARVHECWGNIDGDIKKADKSPEAGVFKAARKNQQKTPVDYRYHVESYLLYCYSPEGNVKMSVFTDASVKQEAANCRRISDTNYSQYHTPVSHPHPQGSTFLDLDPENRNNCFGMWSITFYSNTENILITMADSVGEKQ